MDNYQIGYTLSSEEQDPRKLVRYASLAEDAGFSFAMISDHFHPWIDTQGQSPFVFSTIGALSQVTEALVIGIGVNCPIIRYHPAIVAQAAATCAVLLEGRFVLGVGAGENLNEHIVGYGWPPVRLRHEMLIEAIEIIRSLFTGKLVEYYGEHYTVEDARLYTLPTADIPIIVSAYGPKAATIAGQHGDGFISTKPQRELTKIFEDAGGKEKTKYIQIHGVYDQDLERAKQTAYTYWPTTALKGPLNTELRLPTYFEAASKMVTADDVAEKVVLSHTVDDFLNKAQEYIDAGYDHIYFHQIGPNQEDFLEFAKNELVPGFTNRFNRP